MTELHVGGASILGRGCHSPVTQDTTEIQKKKSPSSTILTKALNRRYNKVINWAVNPKKIVSPALSSHEGKKRRHSLMRVPSFIYNGIYTN